MTNSHFTVAYSKLKQKEIDAALVSYACGIRCCLDISLRPISFAKEIARIHQLGDGDTLPFNYQLAINLLVLAEVIGGTRARDGADFVQLPSEASSWLRTNPILIIAGGAASLSSDQQAQALDLLKTALSTFHGVVIAGGTRSGIPGCAGQATAYIRQNTAKSDFRLLGYLPASLPDGDVTLLGFGGGPIAALEYRIATAFGAKVAVAAEMHGASQNILKDEFWKTAPNLFPLPVDRMTLRNFVTPEQPMKTICEFAIMYPVLYTNIFEGLVIEKPRIQQHLN